VGVEYKKIENDVKTRWCVHMCVCVRARACVCARAAACVRAQARPDSVSYLTQNTKHTQLVNLRHV
jgi:hypothetical protein